MSFFNPRHLRQNLDPRYSRQNFVDPRDSREQRHPRQNFMDPRYPSHPRTHASTLPTLPTNPRYQRYLADSLSTIRVCSDNSENKTKYIYKTERKKNNNRRLVYRKDKQIIRKILDNNTANCDNMVTMAIYN